MKEYIFYCKKMISGKKRKLKKKNQKRKSKKMLKKYIINK